MWNGRTSVSIPTAAHNLSAITSLPLQRPWFTWTSALVYVSFGWRIRLRRVRWRNVNGRFSRLNNVPLRCQQALALRLHFVWALPLMLRPLRLNEFLLCLAANGSLNSGNNIYSLYDFQLQNYNFLTRLSVCAESIKLFRWYAIQLGIKGDD